VNVSQLRRAMGAGVAFVVLFVAGVMVTFGNSPEPKSSDTPARAAHRWVEYLSSSSHRTGLIIGAYLLVLAAIAFVWFSAGLREWFAPDSASGRIMSGLGVLGAGAIAIGSMTGGAGVAGSIAFGNEALPITGDAVRILADVFFPLLFVAFGLVSAALIAMIAVLGVREGRAPAWIGYTAWLAVLGALAGVAFFPFVVTLLWYLAIGIAGLAGAASVADRTDAPSEGFAGKPS
jgi:hypothetical protein